MASNAKMRLFIEWLFTSVFQFDSKIPGLLCDGSLNKAGDFCIHFSSASASFQRLQRPRIISSHTRFERWLKSANTSVFKGFLTWAYYIEIVNSPYNACCTHVVSSLLDRRSAHADLPPGLHPLVWNGWIPLCGGKLWKNAYFKIKMFFLCTCFE